MSKTAHRFVQKVMLNCLKLCVNLLEASLGFVRTFILLFQKLNVVFSQSAYVFVRSIMGFFLTWPEHLAKAKAKARAKAES